ncbi:MAG TPA: PKD domain-containing protein, partial [Vicinamibacterales bacterium]|nr:PKD domain-containing protein [Vicinamibacterales bacterium]
ENTNRAPAAHVGGPYSGEAGAAIAFDGKSSTDPDGDPLTFSWDFGDGSQPGTGDAPSHAYQTSGAFTVTLTVSDGRGGQNSRATTVAVGAAGDRAPPSVTLTGPREVLPGEQVTITAQATDNVKVDKVRFEVDGANPSDALTQPFLRAITVPAVATPGTEILVKATATDPSGNAGIAETTLTITARPDTESPIVLLNAPPLAAPGTTFHVSATARDNAGVQSVAFSLNGGIAQTLTAPPYETTFTVPEGTPVGATLNVRAVAVDFSSNTGDADAMVAVVATPDTQPPTVQLSARATAVAGSTLDLTAAAADNRGIVGVDFYVDGVKVATDADAPYAAAYEIAIATPAGRVLQLEARAMDFAGLEGTDSRQTTIVAITSVAEGALAGEVYDNTTGLPLAGVNIRLAGADIAGAAYTQQAVTDARGRYLINAVEGSGVLEVTRAGWSRVDRLVDIVANKSTEVVDARLTPLTPNPATVNPVLGANVSTPRGTLIIPPGVLSAPAPMTMTAIGQQGLQSLLPAGWAPVAIADVTPHDAAFNSDATLTLSDIENVPASATLTLAVWDEDARKWRAVGSAPRGTGALSHAIAHPGQFAWLIADTTPAAPPPAVAGDFLAGVVAGRVPVDATSVVSPQSKVVFYQPGVSIEVTGLVTLAARVPSGTVVLTRIAEAYQFTTGDEAHVEPYSQDIVLYQPIGGAAGLNARYQVTPSLTFEAATLKSGVITVELFDPPLGPRLSDLISGTGGSVSTETGERADVPPNALTSPVPLQLQALGLEAVGVDIPDGLAFLGGVQVSAAGAQFNEPIVLSMLKPAALPDDASVLIARLTELGNTSRLVLVALGRLVNDRIETSTLIGGAPSALEGIRSPGRYV